MKNNNTRTTKMIKTKVVPINLCFENLYFNYTPGRVVVESKVSREKNKALRDLAKFTTLIIDDCTLNESNGHNTIYVSSYVSGKNKLIKLYEWLKHYVGVKNIDKVAPDLLEALGIENEENSVALRFAKYRRLYEEESDSNNSDEDENNDDNNDDNNDEEDNNKEEEEDEELTAIIIEVAKGDEDKAKEELIEAGVDEDDIEIVDDEEDEEDEDKEDVEEDEELSEDDEEDSDNETVKIKIAVDSFDALKEYLEDKGFNLEDELGGEIVTDDDDEESEDKEDDSEDEFSDFDDIDLFGDEDDEDDKNK